MSPALPGSLWQPPTQQLQEACEMPAQPGCPAPTGSARQAGIPRPHWRLPLPGPGRGGSKTIVLRTKAPVPGRYLGRHSAWLSWVWNSTPASHPHEQGLLTPVLGLAAPLQRQGTEAQSQTQAWAAVFYTHDPFSLPWSSGQPHLP